jgi:hypothetical protein
MRGSSGEKRRKEKRRSLFCCSELANRQSLRDRGEASFFCCFFSEGEPSWNLSKPREERSRIDRGHSLGHREGERGGILFWLLLQSQRAAQSQLITPIIGKLFSVAGSHGIAQSLRSSVREQKKRGAVGSLLLYEEGGQRRRRSGNSHERKSEGKEKEGLQRRRPEDQKREEREAFSAASQREAAQRAKEVLVATVKRRKGAAKGAAAEGEGAREICLPYVAEQMPKVITPQKRAAGARKERSMERKAKEQRASRLSSETIGRKRKEARASLLNCHNSSEKASLLAEPQERRPGGLFQRGLRLSMGEESREEERARSRSRERLRESRSESGEPRSHRAEKRSDSPSVLPEPQAQSVSESEGEEKAFSHLVGEALPIHRAKEGEESVSRRKRRRSGKGRLHERKSEGAGSIAALMETIEKERARSRPPPQIFTLCSICGSAHILPIESTVSRSTIRQSYAHGNMGSESTVSRSTIGRI